jgi:8-hydroxy-5-deazaflavin:NADPH oxidoreductase
MGFQGLEEEERMRFGVLGTGIVGRTLAGKLAELGHEVEVGSREAGEDKVTFADAASFGETVINATSGAGSLAALGQAGGGNLAGKVLIDVSNPLDTSKGMPPTLRVCNDDSLAEQIQREFPDARVVKTLNTVNAGVMVTPDSVPGDHTMFVSGNDEAAKGEVTELLGSFGWPAGRVMDLGGIKAARGQEMYLPMWLGLWRAAGSPQLNIEVRTAAG